MSFFSAPATVDWCEANYQVTPLVAEFYNTVSSLPLAVAGVLGALWCWRAGWPGRFSLGFVGLAVVGLGSAAFHGTLSAWGQALDELPMIYVTLTFLYSLRVRREAAGGRRWRLGLLAYALLFTGAYLGSAQLFVFFILSYAALVTTIVVWSAVVVWRRDARARALYALSLVAYVGGMAVLWLPEQLLGDCGHAALAYQNHAWFHLTSLVGSCGWLLFALDDHHRR